MKKFILLSLILITACGDPVVPGGEITIQNHILDKKYNSFVVDKVTSQRGMTGFRATLKPNDTVVIPHKGVKSLRFTRKYKDHSKIYVVKCPRGFDKKIVMKLIDVHTNRIRGGCKLVRRGTREHGKYVKWE